MTAKTVPQIFSRQRRELRSTRQSLLSQRKGAASWLIEEMEADCVDRLEFVRAEPAKAALHGPTIGVLSAALEHSGCKVETHRSPDEEHPLAGQDFDLIVSLGRLDTVNDLPGALLHYRSALSPVGFLIAQMIGAGSLPVLRSAMLAADAERPAGRIHPQIDNRAATGLLERAGFARQVVDTMHLEVRYSSLERLVQDLRDQGLGSVLADPGPPLGKAALARANAAFDQHRDAEGRVSERFEILTLTGWR